MTEPPISRSEWIALHRIRQGKEQSRALPQQKYRDPAERVTMLKTKDAEALIADEIDNWLRWGRGRDWMPTGFRCPLGFLYKSIDKQIDDEPLRGRPEPIKPLDAAEFERIVIALPERHRQAFVMYHLGRCAKDGVIRIYRGRDDGAKLLGVQVWQYHNIVRQAHNILLREVGK